MRHTTQQQVRSLCSGAAAPRRINLWTGPRSTSTSLMYAFHSRGDCAVFDEPLYAHYLVETGQDRPYRDERVQVELLM